MAALRLFATLWDQSSGRCRILCDGGQRFTFIRSRDGEVVERFSSTDPDRFHRYTYELCARGWDFAWAPKGGTSDGDRDR